MHTDHFHWGKQLETESYDYLPVKTFWAFEYLLSFSEWDAVHNPVAHQALLFYVTVSRPEMGSVTSNEYIWHVLNRRSKYDKTLLWIFIQIYSKAQPSCDFKPGFDGLSICFPLSIDIGRRFVHAYSGVPSTHPLRSVANLGQKHTSKTWWMIVKY